jgi:hypothetical protein
MNAEQISGFTVSGTTYANDELETFHSAVIVTDWDGIKTAANFVGGLGRINYSFANKYLLTASLRIDGCSRFGKEQSVWIFPCSFRRLDYQ